MCTSQDAMRAYFCVYTDGRWEKPKLSLHPLYHVSAQCLCPCLSTFLLYRILQTELSLSFHPHFDLGPQALRYSRPSTLSKRDSNSFWQGPRDLAILLCSAFP